MQSLGAKVLVVDCHRQFVEYVSPAVARAAVRANKVAILRRGRQFTIQLPPGVDCCPVLLSRKRKMATTNRRARLTNFTRYFAEVRESQSDVWVRTVGDRQVSIVVPDAHGEKTSFVVPNTGDPYNITQRFPLEDIQRSPDIRHFVATKQWLELMTTPQVEAFYAKRAKKRGITVEQAIDAAEVRREKIYSLQPMDLGATNKPIDDLAGEGEDTVVRIDQVVNPRVIHLCHQVSMEIPENQRWPASKLLDELEIIENVLTAEDFQYIIGSGRYKSIIRWADTRMKQVLLDPESSADDLDDVDEERVAMR